MAENRVVIRIQALDEASKALNAAAANIARLGVPARRAAEGIDSISVSLQRAKAQFVSLFLVAPQLARLGGGFVRLAESFQQVNARLKNAADGVADFAQSQAAVNRIALSSRQSLESVAGLYAKLRTNAGLASGDAERLTETLSKAVQLDGGGVSAEAALFQLQQGLASGTLRGEELNSVLEQAPSLARAIADGLGVPVGALRQLAEQGKLTTAEIQRALADQADEIETRFSNLPVTVGQALQKIRTQAVTEFGKINESLGITQGLGEALKLVADNMRATIALTVAGTAAITGAWLQSIALRRAAERAAHLAALKEILERKVADLAAAKSAAAAAGSTGGAAVVNAAAGVVQARNALAAASTQTGVLRGALGLLGNAFRLLLGPIGLAVTAIGAVTGLVIGNRDAVIDLGNGQATLGETVRAAWQLIVHAISSAFGAIKQAFAGIAQAGGSAFGAVVDFAKGTVNNLIGLFVAAGKAIGTTFGAIARQVVVNFTALKDVFAGLFADIQAALGGDFSFKNFNGAVSRALNNTRDNLGQFTQSIRDETAKAFGTDYVGAVGKGIARGVKALKNTVGSALLEQVRKNRDAAADAQAAAFFNQENQSATGAAAPASAAGLKKSGEAALREAGRLAQARLELEETLAAQADRLAEDSIRRDIALNKEAFDAKRIEAEAYYARLVGLQETLAGAEIAALERQRNAAAQAAAEAAKRGDQAEVLKASGDVAKLNTDIELARLKLDDFRREAAAGLAEAQADRLKTQFAAIEKQIDVQLTALRDKEQTLKNQVDLGLPQAAAEAQINAARRETLATTAALVDKLAELARLNPQLFGEEAAAQIARYRAGLADLNVVVDSVATRINSAVSTAFEKLFADIASGAATAKDALRAFLSSIVSEVQAVVAKNLSQQILGAILPTGQAGATGGLGGFVSGILGGGGTGKPDGTAANPVYTVSREPLKLDAAGAGGDGGLFGGLRAQLSTLFDGLKSGFTTLFSGLGNALSGLFSGGGGFLSALGEFFGLGFASGGMVSGPGTSTSDSIPARLSAGEYVIRAAAVRRVGVAFLDAINGIKAPPAWNAGRLAFAAGGMVPAVAAQAAPVVNSSTRIVNLFDPSQVAGELGKTREFERAVLNVIQLNPRALQGGF